MTAVTGLHARRRGWRMRVVISRNRLVAASIALIGLAWFIFATHLETKAIEKRVTPSEPVQKVETAPEPTPEPPAPVAAPVAVPEPEPVLELPSSQGVEVRTYCKCLRCCYPYADGKTCKGWSVFRGARYLAISRDLEKEFPIGTIIRIKGLTTATPIRFAGRLLDPDEWIVADRTAKSRVRRIEILITWQRPGYFDVHDFAYKFPNLIDGMLKTENQAHTIRTWPGYDVDEPWSADRWQGP